MLGSGRARSGSGGRRYRLYDLWFIVDFDMSEMRGSSPMSRGLESGFGAPLAALSSLAEAPPPGPNPHGIDHILARPTAGGPVGIGAGMLSPRLSLAAAAAGMAHYLQHKPLYWPGFQGLVSNPMAWRDRLQSSKLFFYFTS